jgi:hypothetical protein
MSAIDALRIQAPPDHFAVPSHSTNTTDARQKEHTCKYQDHVLAHAAK